MNKKIILPLILMVMLAGLGSILIWNKHNEETKEPEVSNQDSKNFASEYTNVTEDNVFVYRNVDEIIKIMEHGTGVVYLGYPECPWCQAYKN